MFDPSKVAMSFRKLLPITTYIRIAGEGVYAIKRTCTRYCCGAPLCFSIFENREGTTAQDKVKKFGLLSVNPKCIGLGVSFESPGKNPRAAKRRAQKRHNKMVKEAFKNG